MEVRGKIAGLIMMILILIFSIIHLGVGAGIISRFRYYGGLFSAERGLAGFNVFIGVIGLLVGILGLFTILSGRIILNRLVWIACCVLSVLSLISLIAALALNSQAIDHVSSNFRENMNRYSIDRNSRNIINRIQTTYECCGESTWLDWYGRSLEQPPTLASSIASTMSSSTESSLTSQTSSTSTETTSESTSTSTSMFAWLGLQRLSSSSSSTSWNIDSIVEAATTNPNDLWNWNSPRAFGDQQSVTTETSTKNPFLINKIPIDLFWPNENSPTAKRRRRQAPKEINTYGLPSSYSLLLPPSCCTTDYQNASDVNALLCVPVYTNEKTNFHPESCSKTLSKMAVGQTLGLAVINSILLVLALLTIPMLKNMYIILSRSQKPYRHESMNNAQLPHEYEGAAVIDKNKNLSVTNPNIDYSVYQ